WSNDWQETVEADGAGGGNAQVQDGFSGDGGGNTELKLKNGNSVWREADLSGAASATLSFDYARVGLEADDHLVVYAQTGGDTGGVGVPGAPGAWDEIGRFSGAADDAAYLSTTIDLSGYLATDTRVLFYAEGASQGDDNIFADNVRIDLGAAPANSPTGATNLTSTSSYTEGDANVAITDIVVSDAFFLSRRR
ncbi:MAG: hypothetical protein KDI82_02950, partial [Gammaproteobacteria bacterium]|nr:hypothetical protein [Gammaproteobacteria bacterium]